MCFHALQCSRDVLSGVKNQATLFSNSKDKSGFDRCNDDTCQKALSKVQYFVLRGYSGGIFLRSSACLQSSSERNLHSSVDKDILRNFLRQLFSKQSGFGPFMFQLHWMATKNLTSLISILMSMGLKKTTF